MVRMTWEASDRGKKSSVCLHMVLECLSLKVVSEFAVKDPVNELAEEKPMKHFVG